MRRKWQKYYNTVVVLQQLCSIVIANTSTISSYVVLLQDNHFTAWKPNKASRYWNVASVRLDCHTLKYTLFHVKNMF